MFPIKDDQPRYSTPYINTFLIVLNILIFFYQWTLGPRAGEAFVRIYGEVPSHLAAFLAGSHRYTLPAVVIPFFTSMFLHGGWMHVLGNMWFLYIFGDNIEDYLGHFKYLIDRDGDTGSDLSGIADPNRGSQRRHRRSPGSVFPALPASASADMVFRFRALPSGLDRAGRVDRYSVLERHGHTVDESAARCWWGRLLGTHRGICCGHGVD